MNDWGTMVIDAVSLLRWNLAKARAINRSCSAALAPYNTSIGIVFSLLAVSIVVRQIDVSLWPSDLASLIAQTVTPIEVVMSVLRMILVLVVWFMVGATCQLRMNALSLRSLYEL
jgi:hypothetical protein